MGRRDAARPLLRLVLTLSGITWFYQRGQRIPKDFRVQRRSRDDGARGRNHHKNGRRQRRGAQRRRYTKEQRGRSGR
ncbi:hypothetical protein NDU88_001212 [Pleurodeles waltl]|uniref:Secreted protein n=1 Tax=Pleurodeles waltl TaxID=8319 RepID=A0AAV7KS66_PLEWA|nr:hypothetical protein NDU88_001212 [Pleurodeles waltl]